MGSIQSLENGNYFINTTGSGGTLLEVNEQGDLLWEINLNLSWPSGSGYRAYRIPSLHPAIFSVVFDNYVQINTDTLFNTIELTNINDYINFSIYNKSGYSIQYNYELTNLMGESFEETQDSIYIEAYSNQEVVIFPSDPIDSMQKIEFKISPENHPYLEKTLSYNVIYNELDINIGDVNFDGSIDIIDVIIIMDYIIFEQEINDTQLYISDLNSDLIINVMDIIILVEYILLN